MTETRTIKVEALTRVEGEGGLHIRMNGSVIEDVQLSIYEPPRFFEAFLHGRPLEDVPDLTARICGICPVAYQMSSVHALEAALGAQISPEIRKLRRLLYCGEWIESHALHMHLLHAPDFFDADSGIDLASQFPDEINRGLQLKKHGNTLLEVLGGRAIHPINVAIGGFYRAPRRDELQKLIPDFEWGLQAAIEATRWVAGFTFPDFERDYEMVALSHPDEYAMNEGRLRSTSGLDISVAEYEQNFHEQHAQHSTALQSVKEPSATAADNPTPLADLHFSQGCYHVGPLARVNLNRETLSPAAKRTADEIGFDTPCWNPFKAIIARGLELIHAFEEGLEILRDYRPVKPPKIPYDYKAGEGMAATEAPRGMLYHRYKVDDNGKVTFANIVPPTSQNQRQIEADLRDYLPRVLCEYDRQTAVGCEKLIRSYDPCISCSTHFLKITWGQAGKQETR
ncbi:Ni/Fe hydrogenase subunit alpha [Fuerstiella marisgermanici]|uniref:NAD-reducing hydrogenase HoxS subunit beta n=1 Tax=Fuerstiella marisgermanici TaxID=1891926 RepID=A0A1P8WCE5_9PLAN|nr:Ni/Fe hydrogenase subunit alpha [Fuerstiella marisgermanici]APZ91732.1 NAD-reducing hydrogenase HoxS subunit beta [Fuerstiella marisgermanici]